MKTLLICPASSSGVRALSEFGPLVTLPVLGQSLLEYWLADLALRVVTGRDADASPHTRDTNPAARPNSRAVTIVAADRPERILNIVGAGERWGLDITVVPQLSPGACAGSGSGAAEGDTWILDHFPGRPRFPLFSSYRSWFAGLVEWMPHAIMPDRYGIRQSKPGIWISCGARVSSTAELHPPCWIGSHVTIGPRATVGPRAIIEESAFVEDDSHVAFSYVAPNTYIGPYAELQYSLAFGSSLISWQTGSEVTVTDPFLLASFHDHSSGLQPSDIVSSFEPGS